MLCEKCGARIIIGTIIDDERLCDNCIKRENTMKEMNKRYNKMPY